MNKNDIRYARREKQILDAFVTLYSKIPFSKIHISTLCSKAGIARKTFYIHYESLDDLLNAVCEKLEDDIRVELTDKIVNQMLYSDFGDPTRWHMRQVELHKDIIRPLLRQDPGRYRDMCIRFYYDLPWSKVIPGYASRKKEPRVYLSIAYLVNGMMGFITEWLEHEDDYSFDEACLLMQKLCEKPASLFVQTLRQ